MSVPSVYINKPLFLNLVDEKQIVIISGEKTVYALFN
jgi:hypothetical protein